MGVWGSPGGAGAGGAMESASGACRGEGGLGGHWGGCKGVWGAMGGEEPVEIWGGGGCEGGYMWG